MTDAPTPQPSAPSSTPPYTPPAQPAKGPLGRPRSIGMVILLTIITLGIYGLYWTYVTYEELKRHNGKGLGGLVGLIIGIFIGIVNLFVLPSEIQTTYQDDGRESPISPLVGLWFLLPLAGLIIWFVKVQGALNDYWMTKEALSA